jgi:hypothetical protein
MPETSQFTFSFKEVVTALIKSQGLHDGIWGLFVNFGLSASNVGQTESEMKPAAIIPILQLGLQKFDKETSLSVDAAKVNPRPASVSKLKKAPN